MSTDITISKTWLFNVNNACEYLSGGGDDQNRLALWRCKNVILGGAGSEGWTDAAGASVSAPTTWTTDYSSTNTTAGTPGDGVDRWTTLSNLVWGTVAGANSWYVFKNTTAISGKTLYWLWTLEGSGTDTRFITMYWSTVGFTGGSTTARPTATDEQLMRSYTFWGAVYGLCTFHVWMSSDGSHTRVAWTQYRNLVGTWFLEPLADPAAGLHDNMFANVAANGSYLLTTHLTNTSSYVAGSSSNENISGCFSGEGSYWAAGVQYRQSESHRPLWNSVSLRNDFGPVSIWAIQNAVSTPRRGHLGSLTDLWWGNDYIQTGMTFPNDYSRKFVMLGPLIYPWNSTVPRIV